MLLKLLEQPRSANELPRDVASKFTKHGLVTKQAFRYKITVKGQLESMRQRFRHMTRRRIVTITGASFREKFDRALADRFPRATRSGHADDAEK